MKYTPYNRREGEKRLNRLRRILTALACAFMLTALLPPVRSFWVQACCNAGFNDFTGQELPLEIHIIDVGKADAILIKSEGHAALLDAGDFLKGDKVADYLARYGVRSLDYVIMSHPDSDHMGGMPGVVSDVETKEFLRGEIPESAAEGMAGLWRTLEERSVPERVLGLGESFTLGQAEFSVLGPVREYADTNNSSLVLRMDCGGFSALFCGDMEKEAEEDLLRSGQELAVDLLKVAHHGSATSSTEEFIDQVSPRCAVVSTGRDRNQLPREKPLETIEATGARIYRTDTDGTIKITFDGEEVLITTEK